MRAHLSRGRSNQSRPIIPTFQAKPIPHRGSSPKRDVPTQGWIRHQATRTSITRPSPSTAIRSAICQPTHVHRSFEWPKEVCG